MPTPEITKAGALLTQQAGLFGTGITLSNLLLATLNLLFGGIFVAAVKNIPKLKEISSKRASTLDDERRSDMDVMRADIKELRVMVQDAQEKAQTAERKLVYAVSAFQLLAARVRSEWPDDPALSQATELIAAAIKGDMPGFAEKLAVRIGKK